MERMPPEGSETPPKRGRSNGRSAPVDLMHPLRGWRAFAGEVSVVVIGVLLALGAEQAVQTLHNRSQVDKAAEKLNAESADNRHVIDYNLQRLNVLGSVVDRDIAALGGCRNPAAIGDLEPIPQDPVFQPGNVAWQGIRDGALLQLMPTLAVDNYSKIDSMLGAHSTRLLDLQRSIDKTTGAVESLRGGGLNGELCGETLLALNELKQIDRSVTQFDALLRVANERALHGERIDINLAALPPQPQR
jgi:hypothetical protein